MKRLFRILEDVGGVLLGLMTLLVLFQVITRYVVKSPPPWAEEIARYVMIWGTLLVSAVLTFEKGHINLDYFFNRLSSTVARGLRVILGLAMASFLVAFLVSSLGLISTAIQVSQRSPGGGLPMAVVYVVLPLAAVLMLIAQIFDIVDAARRH